MARAGAKGYERSARLMPIAMSAPPMAEIVSTSGI
jgi:hypothetical protein